ncbi:MAG: ATP-binding cassette domain-containing protein, partial [Deltaproteobacteria bacterium]|nr:ATP-binding cassette domain-containing protein [Candidatus Zymogenaceae bacterium]
MDTKAIIETKNLEKTYEDSKVAVRALRGVDLEVHEGEFMALSGPSGSGKTTLLNIIGALDYPTGGTVRVAGEDLSGFSKSELSKLRLNRIGFIFQAYNLIPVLTARENVEYVMLLQGVDERERVERAETILTDVGLKDYIDARPNEMSGGQQ